ncbi:MBL fold metallo-hydrolase [Psychroserpens sp.]|uniref:MBL fold metallo-hydrolase n=1 Tax=Psychroserpens sp. TaxID=2020870 RepID=UPI001B25C6AF|nr:MBL fold metallo-hydrolase [Psychroserpens sp.]MBO6607189.1 MBL fold metallo-hydrolase [Psychroserpens sp.]MBO6631293.1 MBL fold metallo-hydrolase [Psychroserpens sp.]MBO6654335.1 MBL fold metallo-hydrolase [Psychroserpens sp.]MBO6682379.1 MBL fold metallo-hydrolase [Psychroserpens sp.]MBO6750961.1 MBL fold metallo-hydrolase [Psychroserpens sp.]
MKIHHIRNATLIIETQDKLILVDPMLGKKGTAAPPFSFIRFKPKRNPIVDLPDNAMGLIERTTHCLITHLHADHFDKAAISFLTKKQIPVICSFNDEAEIRKKGIHVSQVIHYWKEQEFFDGKIQGIPARHGYGYVAKPMGNVMGFHIQLPNEKSLYISSDTIYTDDVHKALTELKPDISIVASGSAQLDLFQPLLMRMDDILKFIQNAPGKVIANHLEAVNHCPTTRSQLQNEINELALSNKVYIPEDGDVIEFK